MTKGSVAGSFPFRISEGARILRAGNRAASTSKRRENLQAKCKKFALDQKNDPREVDSSTPELICDFIAFIAESFATEVNHPSK